MSRNSDKRPIGNFRLSFQQRSIGIAEKDEGDIPKKAVEGPSGHGSPTLEGESEARWFIGSYSEYEADRRKRLGAVADRPHRITYRKLTR